jgi:dihydrolipoamide dehydrogenase
LNLAEGQSYDVVVIGAGPGGYVAAVRAAQIGLKTAIVERDKALGGTCLLRGCIPTKFLLQAASLHDDFHAMGRYGLTAQGLDIDWKKTQTEKTKTVRRLTSAVKGLMKKGGIDVHAGHGSIERPGKVTVEMNAGGTETLNTRFILIATGSYPKMLPFLERDGKRVITSDEALELARIPKSLIVCGSGAVGSEFASIYNSFGSKVTLLEALPRLVPGEDTDVSAELTKAFRKRGIEVRVGAMLAGAEVTKDDVTVKLTTEKGESESITAEILLVAVGRGPISENLGLENTKIKPDPGGFIPVDPYMRTAEEGIYAIGDVVPTQGLAHLASKEGILAVEHMAGHEVTPIRYETVPNAIYSDPEVGSVGLTEETARDWPTQSTTRSWEFTSSGTRRPSSSPRRWWV